MFQFHKVRLKGDCRRVCPLGHLLFQFHKVRLKVRFHGQA